MNESGEKSRERIDTQKRDADRKQREAFDNARKAAADAQRRGRRQERRAVRGRVAKGWDWTVPGLGLEMVWISPGTFVMGSPESELGRSHHEGPQTRVRLSRGYWLGRYPVTQGERKEVTWDNPYRFEGRDRPVEQVSWEDAMDFCRTLTQRDGNAGRLPEGYEYTLPSEAQWEYACRAGSTTSYCYGEAEEELGAYAWYAENSTHPVGEKLPNAWGLYDMHGNVWEWCRDWYGGKLPGGSVGDPAGPSSGSYRVSRGGSWFNSARNCRSANRNWFAPGHRSNFLGFRLALSSVR